MSRINPASAPEKPSVPLKYWLFLLAAIVLEVGGTAIMKYSQGLTGYGPQVGYGGMLLCIGFSYYCLALSTQKLPVGVAFACWEGVGLTLITLCSVLLLGESFSLTRLGALTAVLLGVLLIHHGTEHGTEHGDDLPGTQPAPHDHNLAQSEVRS